MQSIIDISMCVSVCECMYVRVDNIAEEYGDSTIYTRYCFNEQQATWGNAIPLFEKPSEE